MQEAGLVTGFEELPQDLSVEDVALAVGEQLDRVRALLPEAPEDELRLVLLSVMYFDFEFTSSPPTDDEPEQDLTSPGAEESNAASSDASSAPSAGALDSDLFKRWLAELDDLDCQASEWAEAREFGEQVRLLADRKRNEAEQTLSAGPVLERLDAIRDHHAETLAAFGRELRVDVVPAEQLAELAATAAQLDELNALFDEYVTLLASPSRVRWPSARSAARRKRGLNGNRLGARCRPDNAVGGTRWEQRG